MAPFFLGSCLRSAGDLPMGRLESFFRIFSLAVRIALLAPLSGPMALQGALVSRQVHAAAELAIVDFEDH